MNDILQNFVTFTIKIPENKGLLIGSTDFSKNQWSVKGLIIHTAPLKFKKKLMSSILAQTEIRWSGIFFDETTYHTNDG